VAIAGWDGGVRTELQIDAMSMELANEYAQSDVHASNPFGWSSIPTISSGGSRPRMGSQI
jgi:hypothetical protein